MKRISDLEKERRDFLKKELKEYEKSIIDLTPDEQKDLREWVKEGRSCYDNPWYVSTGNGYPVDYIKASRFFDYMCEHPDEYSFEAPADVDADVDADYDFYEGLGTEDLPFSRPYH